MKQLSTVYLLVFFIVSCTSIKEKKIERNKFAQLILLDGYSKDYKKDSLIFKKPMSFYPIYIGKVEDTITLIYDRFSPRISTLAYNKLENTNSPSKQNLSIFIDTSKIIPSSKPLMPTPPSWKSNDAHLDSQLKNNAYPIYLSNTGSDTLKIGIAVYTLPMCIQIMDSTNNWVSMTKHSGLPLLCDTKASEYYISPNEIAITSINKFEGSKIRKLRVYFISDMDTIYSNEIKSKSE